MSPHSLRVAARWPALLAATAALASFYGCSDEVGIEDDRPARSGAVQPAGNGTAIDEDDACSAIVGAIETKATQLDCERPASEDDCPELIRPAGGDACLQYDEGTVQACVDHIGAYGSCGEFDRSPCIVSTIAGSSTPGCDAPVFDAGADGSVDAGGGDAGGDASGDAAGDVAIDTTADVATDSADDGAMDAASDVIDGAAGDSASSDAQTD